MALIYSKKVLDDLTFHFRILRHLVNENNRQSKFVSQKKNGKIGIHFNGSICIEIIKYTRIFHTVNPRIMLSVVAQFCKKGILQKLHFKSRKKNSSLKCV